MNSKVSFNRPRPLNSTLYVYVYHYVHLSIVVDVPKYYLKIEKMASCIGATKGAWIKRGHQSPFSQDPIEAQPEPKQLQWMRPVARTKAACRIDEEDANVWPYQKHIKRIIICCAFLI